MLDGNELLTAREIAGFLSLSVETIWRYTREKRIPFVEVGSRQYRYRKKDVLRALDEAEHSTAAEEAASYGTKKMTYEDYAKLPDEPGFRHEIIDGVLVREPSPSFQHQRVSRRLHRVLEDYFSTIDPGGEVFGAPLDVTFTEYTVVQPDLLYLPSSRPAKRTPIDSLPELIVEVLSPSTTRTDRVTKLDRYQAYQVPHYWIVDPDSGVVEAYELRDGNYMSMVRAYEGDFTHPSFPGLSFDVSALFRDHLACSPP